MLCFKVWVVVIVGLNLVACFVSRLGLGLGFGVKVNVSLRIVAGVWVSVFVRVKI
jgi:hypothetical protein